MIHILKGNFTDFMHEDENQAWDIYWDLWKDVFELHYGKCRIPKHKGGMFKYCSHLLKVHYVV